MLDYDRMRIPIAVQLALLVLLTAVSGIAVLAIATVNVPAHVESRCSLTWESSGLQRMIS